MTKQQKKQLSELIKPVSKVSLSELIPGITTNPQQAYAIVVGEQDERKIVSVCSEKYHLLPNKEFIEPLLEIFEGQEIELFSSSRLDSRFELDVVFKNHFVKIGKEDINAKLKIYNSYDGRVKFQFNMGFYRLICSNGLTIPLEGYENTNVQKKIRHMPLLEVIDKTLISDMVGLFYENIKDFSKPYLELHNSKISIEELPTLLSTVADKTKFPIRQLETVVDTLQDEMNQLGTKIPNKWLIYNAFNYQLNHSEEINMDGYKKEDIDRQVMGTLLSY